MSDSTADARSQALARALSSPLRLRVLRLCAFEARTNRELAGLLDVNPGTMLHHVRTLVATGLLAAETERAGAQGAREIPYRATGRSWDAQVPGQTAIILETLRQQLQVVDQEQIWTAWLGLRLNAEHKAELDQRLLTLFQEYKDSGPDADGESYSLVTVLHPDLNPPGEDPPAGDGGEGRGS